MSSYQAKHISINEFNVKIFMERLNGTSLQPFVNSLLEKFMCGKLVELNEENFIKIKNISDQMKISASEAANEALEPFEFDVKETPKIRITLDRQKKRVKHIKPGRNPITDYG